MVGRLTAFTLAWGYGASSSSKKPPNAPVGSSKWTSRIQWRGAPSSPGAFIGQVLSGSGIQTARRVAGPPRTPGRAHEVPRVGAAEAPAALGAPRDDVREELRAGHAFQAREVSGLRRGGR